MKSLLFVCTGNTCRSPMAEGIARLVLEGRPGWKVASAGVGAINGQAASTHAVTAMRQLGRDISGHRSQMLTAQLVREADYIFALTQSHAEGILYYHPEAAEKLFLLREFDDSVESFDKDIADPIGGPLPGYVETRNQIEAGVRTAIAFIERHAAETAAAHAAPPDFALGSDHAGFHLKESLKPVLQHLEVAVDTGIIYGQQPAAQPRFDCRT